MARINKEASSPFFTSIPILDFSQTASVETKPVFIRELRDALLNVGFFYVKNTPLPAEVVTSLMAQTVNVFDMPLEKKLEVAMVNSKHFLGYSPLGAEKTGQMADYREQFDFSTELPAPASDEPVYRNVRGPNQWPDETVVPGFRHVIETYLRVITQIAEAFKTLVAEALDLEPDSLLRLFDVPPQIKMKLVKYPPPPQSSGSKEHINLQGSGPHKDGSFLTYLLQGTPHRGLEVQNKAGDWISVPPIPGTLVVNIGRSLESITRGVCVATTHRVRLDSDYFRASDGSSLGPRYSFPAFQSLSLELTQENMFLDLPAHIAALAKDRELNSDVEEAFKDVYNGSIGEGTFMARLTSHPDVAQRWYPAETIRALRRQKGIKDKSHNHTRRE